MKEEQNEKIQMNKESSEKARKGKKERNKESK
jgi:hypothetical protein